MTSAALNGERRRKGRFKQIVVRLREVERALAQGKTVDQICKKLAITEQTYYRWRREYGGMTENQLQRLKELERENTNRKKIVADQALDIRMLKDVAEGNF